jgi:uncharacterized protein (TIGR03083 family)
VTQRSLADHRRWAKDGFEELRRAASTLSEAELDEPSRLPEWNRRHVVAHVAANADALHNLVRWAATGEPTPMYASPEQRTAGIIRGARLWRTELLAWLDRSGTRLENAFDRLAPERWDAQVRTAQGREVPASEVPWMRAREVWVHAVDLGAESTFDDQPEDFLAALADDVVARRSVSPAVAVEIDAGGYHWSLPGYGEPVLVTGPLSQAVAYLTGRAHRLTTADSGSGSGQVPRLGAWL